MAKTGIPVCETDTIGHAVLEQDSEVRAAVSREFGESVVGAEGRIDRNALGRVVFADPLKRERLNSLIHPAILRRMADWLGETAKAHAYAVVIIPLLYEIGAEKEWDKVICVASPEADQLRRLAERGLTPDEARARLGAQASLATKMEWSDYVIYNCGSIPLLEEQTKQVWRSIRGV